MNKTAIIHLGSYKTGTSSIQNWLFHNRDILNSKGIEYPLEGLRLSEPEVGIRHHRLVYGAKWENTCLKVVDDIKNSNFQKHVLSEEAWSRPTTGTKLEFLLSALRSHGIQVTGIIYLRNYFKFIRSYYREFCFRRNNQKPFPEFYSAYRNGLFNYYRVASNLSSLFKGDIIFRNFDSLDDVTSDFLERVAPELPYVSSQQFNSGIGPVEAEVARLINSQSLKIDLPHACQVITDKLGLSAQRMKSNFIENTDFIEAPTRAYKRKLSNQLFWSGDEINELFTPDEGDAVRLDISTVSEEIRQALSQLEREN